VSPSEAPRGGGDEAGLEARQKWREGEDSLKSLAVSGLKMRLPGNRACPNVQYGQSSWQAHGADNATNVTPKYDPQLGHCTV
jgi:hypothetical protein